MSDLIDRQTAIDALLAERKNCSEKMESLLNAEMFFARSTVKAERNRIDADIDIINDLPTVDVVGQSVVDQIRWERDTAIAQLAEIGKGFGEQMDDVVEVKHGRWIKRKNFLCQPIARCSECGNYLDLSGVNGGRGDANYCPNCGADMRENVDEDINVLNKTQRGDAE